MEETLPSSSGCSVKSLSTALKSVSLTTKYSFAHIQLHTQKTTNLPINLISFSVFTVGIAKIVVF
jgi:hypothetical protein